MSRCIDCAQKRISQLHTVFIIPLNPCFIFADGGINRGTGNVMINCNYFNTDYQQIIRWYSPDEEEILEEPADLPYVTFFWLFLYSIAHIKEPTIVESIMTHYLLYY